MKQNKLMVIIISILVLSNLSIYFYYQNNAEALSLSDFNIFLSSKTTTEPIITLLAGEYSIPYSSFSSLKIIETQENQKGCEKISTNYSKEDGSEGILVFTCSRLNESEQPSSLISLTQRIETLEQRLDNAKIP